MIKSFLQGLVEVEVARQLAEQEQRQRVAARLERRGDIWPMATTEADLAAMVSDGRLVDLAPVARNLVRRVVDNSPSGWSEVRCGIECRVFMSTAAGAAVAKTAEPAVTLRTLLLTVGGLLERADAASGRVRPTRHNPRFPSVMARHEGVEVLAQVCPRPDGSSAFLVLHLPFEPCPGWHDESRFE